MPSDYKSLGDRQGGDPNVMTIKEVNKVRPLDNLVAGWRQHGIEHPSDPEQFASAVCPGTRSCPMCRKPVNSKGDQRFPVSRRFGANVWDYDTQSVKVLIAGPQVFDKFKEAATVGIDPSSCDWTIAKTGSGRNTTYNVVRHDSSPFTGTQITENSLHDVAKYEEPDSTQKIFDKLEKFGINYDELEVPSYTLEQALAFTMPYGKHKGYTIERLVQDEQSYAEYIYGAKLEQGALGDPVFIALQVVLEDREVVAPLDEALAMMPEPDEPEPQSSASNQVTASTVSGNVPVEATLSPSSANMVKLIGPDGAEITVPSSAADGLLAAGFTRPTPPQPTTSVDANAPMEVLIGGQKVSVPREQALMLIEAGTAGEIKDPAEEEMKEREEPKIPLPDEIVQVRIGGAEVPMPYVQAAQVVDNKASGASFVDDAVTAAHERVNGGNPSPMPSSGTDSSQASGQDEEHPFKCDQCTRAFKSQSALTGHKNREHKAAEPQPSSVPASESSDLRERVKSKVASATYAKDYTHMMSMFKEVTGQSNFVQMTDEQLILLETRLDEDAVKEAVGAA